MRYQISVMTNSTAVLQIVGAEAPVEGPAQSGAGTRSSRHVDMLGAAMTRQEGLPSAAA